MKAGLKGGSVFHFDIGHSTFNVQYSVFKGQSRKGINAAPRFTQYGFSTSLLDIQYSIFDILYVKAKA